MPPAQAFHKMEMFVKMRLMGAKGPAQVQPLKEERAIEVGAELIGEAFIFSVAAAFVLYEYNKSVKKEAAKEGERKKDMEKMRAQLDRLGEDMRLVKEALEQTGVLKKTEIQSENVKPTEVKNESLLGRVVKWIGTN
eukprot:Em0019g708a